MLAEYDNYVFDLYGTLVDVRTDESAPTFWRALAYEMCLRGVPTTAASLKESYSRLCEILQEWAEAALKEWNVPGPAEINILDVWREYLESRNRVWPEAELWTFARTFRALSLKKLRLYPEVPRLLFTLRDAGKKIFLLTNAQPAFTRPELRYLGLTNCFDAILISGEHGVKKPSPGFYGLLKKEGLDFSRTLMIGNDDECDCRAAARVGLDSLYIRTAQSPVPSGPLPQNCREIRSLKAVFPLR